MSKIINGCNALTEAMGDVATVRNITITNTSCIKQIEPFTASAIPAHGQVELTLIGDFAWNNLQQNINMINSLGVGGLSVIESGGNSGGNGYADWTFTNATYSGNTARWDGEGTIYNGVDYISGYQVDAPSGLGEINIIVNDMANPMCAFKVEAIGDGGDVESFEIISILTDENALKQYDFVNNTVDATGTKFIKITNDNGNMNINLRNLEGVEIYNQVLPMPDLNLMPIRITAIFVDPSHAFPTLVDDGVNFEMSA